MGVRPTNVTRCTLMGQHHTRPMEVLGWAGSSGDNKQTEQNRSSATAAAFLQQACPPPPRAPSRHHHSIRDPDTGTPPLPPPLSIPPVGALVLPLAAARPQRRSRPSGFDPPVLPSVPMPPACLGELLVKIGYGCANLCCVLGLQSLARRRPCLMPPLVTTCSMKCLVPNACRWLWLRGRLLAPNLLHGLASLVLLSLSKMFVGVLWASFELNSTFTEGMRNSACKELALSYRRHH